MRSDSIPKLGLNNLKLLVAWTKAHSGTTSGSHDVYRGVVRKWTTAGASDSQSFEKQNSMLQIVFSSAQEVA